MSWLKPIPEITAENAPFFAALRKREFLVPRCQACGDYNWTPYPACRSCLSLDQRWIAVSGKGELYTYSTIHVGPKIFADEGPYVLAVAKLDEGPRPLLVMANLRGCPLESIAVGMRLRIAYHDVAEHDLTLYHFEPDL